MTDANDIPARLRELADRAENGDFLGVIVITVPGYTDKVEVFSFGQEVEDGAQVDRRLSKAKQVIRK